jgi:hypothetical protein
MPVGPWSQDKKLKEVGRWHLLECYEGIEGWSMALLTRLMGVSSRQTCFLYGDEAFTDSVFECQWAVAEVHVFLAEVRNAFKDRSIHSYSPA